MRRAAGRGPTDREWAPPFRHPKSFLRTLGNVTLVPPHPHRPPLELGALRRADSPSPAVPLCPYLPVGRPGRRGVGGEGRTGSSTAPGPEQSLRRGPPWPRAGARKTARGDRHRAGRLTATLGAWPSQDPNPGSECLGDALGTAVSQHFLHSPQGILVGNKRALGPCQKQLPSALSA